MMGDGRKQKTNNQTVSTVWLHIQDKSSAQLKKCLFSSTKLDFLQQLKNFPFIKSHPTSKLEVTFHEHSMSVFLFLCGLYVIQTRCSSFMNFSENEHMSFSLLEPFLLKYRDSSNTDMWRSAFISETSPFVFFHQRKAGGTSLRATINLSAKALKLSSFIPCLDGVHCRTFTPPLHDTNNDNYAIYAGHLSWHDLKGIKYNNFSCLTNFREPVSRVTTCIYFRFHEEFGRKNISCINDIAIDDFAQLLVEKTDRDHHSCLNEPFRILSGISDENTINRLGFDYDSSTHKVVARFHDNDVMVMRDTLEHLTQCVPIVLEQPESRALLNRSFPSLYQLNAFTDSVQINTNFRQPKHCEAPDEAHLEVIRNLTAYENVLYTTVLSKIHSALTEFNISIATQRPVIKKPGQRVTLKSFMAQAGMPGSVTSSGLQRQKNPKRRKKPNNSAQKRKKEQEDT